MNSFYCNNCNNEVVLVNGKCPKCGKDWGTVSKNISSEMGVKVKKSDVYDDKLYDEEVLERKSIKHSDKKIINNSFKEREEDIKNTYDYFFYWGYFIKVLSFIVAIVVVVLSILYVSKSSGLSLIGVIFALIVVLEGIMVEKRYKWKAYLLQTNYEIASKK